MRQQIILCLAGLALGMAIAVLPDPGHGQQRVNFGTATKTSPWYYLTMVVAQDKGIWKENGVDVQWVPFQAGTPMNQAVIAGSVQMGFQLASSQIQAAARGVPVIMVAELVAEEDFTIWVRADSPLKEARDLRNARFGVGRFGGAEHAYARVVARAVEAEKEMKFVATGGISQSLASLRTRSIDAVALTRSQVIMLLTAGQVRALAHLADYLPKDWVSYVVFSHKGFTRSHPDSVKRVINGVLATLAFIRANPGYSMEKMKTESGYSDAAAKAMYDQMVAAFTKEGKISGKALANVVNFLVEFGIVPKDKVPRLEEVYTPEFTG